MITNIVIFFLVAVLFTLIMVVITQPHGRQLESGVVIQKEYIPPCRTLHFRTVGKITVPYYITREEQWKLCVRGEKDGKVITEWWIVSKKAYNAYHIGTHVYWPK